MMITLQGGTELVGQSGKRIVTLFLVIILVL